MTHEDYELDPSVLILQSPLTLFRYARLQYANLTGIGSSRAPGRWNRFGERAVYASTERGVPILERLVHTPKNRIPTNLAMMEIRLTGKWNLNQNRLFDSSTGAFIRICSTLRIAKSYFQANRKTADLEDSIIALAVPSVIVPVWNLVLFPKGRGFGKHVSLSKVSRFDFDPRLFPEDAGLEETA